VRDAIGFAVSGIPPVAGTPNVVFKLTFRHLVSPGGGASLPLRALKSNSNGLRFLAYFPQIAKAIKDRSGAEAISFGTWALFLASHASAMAYAIENQGD
jgi:hypothetical protein